MNTKDQITVSLFSKLLAHISAKLFGSAAQPSVRRGALLLAALIFLNVLVGIVLVFLGARYPILFGLTVLAWGLGFRHAMDADHISAIDNVTRRLLYRGKPSVGVGFFFSLGHSTVVFLLTIAIVLFSSFTEGNLDSLKEIGGIIGAGVSSVFLLFIGTANLFVLFKLMSALRNISEGKENTYHGHMHLGGPIEKLFRPLVKLVDKSYKMYFIGFLFGLGFDTATEIGLLSIAALASVSIPLWAVLLLPLAFMAGMALLDTLNGLFMLGIYAGGIFDEKRRLLYGINVTLLSALSALVIGLTVGLRLLAEHFGFTGEIFSMAQKLSIDNLGYWLAASFVLSWIVALFGFRSKEKTVVL